MDQPNTNHSSPDTYRELKEALNSMNPENQYELERDEEYPDRFTVRDEKTKKELVLNAAPEQAKVGQVWVLSSNGVDPQETALGPGIHADQKTVVGPDNQNKHADTTFTATDATYNFASTIDHAFGNARYGRDVQTAFHTLVSQGDPENGILPLPTLEKHGYGNTRALSLNQMTFTMSTDGVRSNADESAEMRKLYAINVSNAYLGKDSGVDEIRQTKANRGNTPEAKEIDSRSDLTWKRLADLQARPNKHGRLQVPLNVDKMGVRPDGSYFSTSGNEALKNEKLGSGSDQVTRWKMDEKGRPVPVKARPITNSERPEYAISNFLYPGGIEKDGREGELMTVLHTPTTVSGGGHAYKKEEIPDFDFWGHRADTSIGLKGLNANKLLSGDQKVEIGGYMGQVHGLGKRISTYGNVETDGVNEAITHEHGSSQWAATAEHTTVLPRWYDPLTGGWSSKREKGFLSTAKKLPEFKKVFGDNVTVGKENFPSIFVPGTSWAGSSSKGNNAKFVGKQTGVDQFVGEGDSKRRLTVATGEYKGPSFMTNVFGSMSYDMVQQSAGEWEEKAPGYGAKIQKYLADNHKAQSDAGEQMRVDPDAMAEAIGYDKGGDGLGMMIDWFDNTIMNQDPDSQRNKDNLKNYGNALSDGNDEVFADMWTHDSRRSTKENWIRDDPENGEKRFNDTFRFVDRKDGMIEAYQKVPRGELITTHIQARRGENIHGQGVSSDFMRGMTAQVPELATLMGLNLDTVEPKSSIQKAHLGTLKWASRQAERAEAISGGMVSVADVPEGAKEISDEMLSKIGGHLKTISGLSPADKALSVSETFGEGIDSTDVLFNKTLGMIMPNYVGVAAQVYQNQGTESAGLAKPVMEQYATMGSDILNPDVDIDEKRARANDRSNASLSYAKELITGGSFVKDLTASTSTMSASARYTVRTDLSAGEMTVDRTIARKIANQNDLTGEAGDQAVDKIMNTSTMAVVARTPFVDGQVDVLNKVTEKEMESRAYSPEAYKYIQATAQDDDGTLGLSLALQNSSTGDGDKDIVEAEVAMKKKDGELVRINNEQAQSQVTTYEGVRAREAAIFPNQEQSNDANSGVKAAKDFREKAGKLGKSLMAKAGWRSAGDMLAMQTKATEGMLQGTIGMGTTYNLRRKLSGTMAFMGTGKEQRKAVEAMFPSQYQLLLDKTLRGKESTGTQVSALFARSYFHKEYQKFDKDNNPLPQKNMLRLYSTDSKTRQNTQIEQRDEQGNVLDSHKIISAETVQSHDVDVAGAFNNPAVQYGAFGFMAKAFSGGAHMAGVDTPINMQKKSFAALMAPTAPGEFQKLNSMLATEEERDLWPQQLADYHSDFSTRKRAEGWSDQQIAEAKWSAPGPAAAVMNAVSGTVANIDPLTGEESHPGSEEGAAAWLGQTSSVYQERMGGAVLGSDWFNRLKGKGLRSFYPSNFIKALPHLSQDVTDMASRSLHALARIAGFSKDEKLTKIQNVPTPQSSPKEQALRQVQGPSPTSDAEASFDVNMDNVGEIDFSSKGGDYSMDQTIAEKMSQGIPLSKEEQAYEDEASGIAPAPLTSAKTKAAKPKRNKGAALNKLQKAFEDPNTVYLDTETTGTEDEDEVVSMSIRDHEGKSLFNKKILPTKAPMTPGAEAVHGISMESLKDAPTWGDVSEEVSGILKGKNVVAHNAPFDLGKIQQSEAASGGTTDFAKQSNWVDSLPAARQQKGKKEAKLPMALGAIADRKGVVVKDEEAIAAHDASYDTAMLHGVTQKIGEEEGWTPPAPEADLAKVDTAGNEYSVKQETVKKPKVTAKKTKRTPTANADDPAHQPFDLAALDAKRNTKAKEYVEKTPEEYSALLAADGFTGDGSGGNNNNNNPPTTPPDDPNDPNDPKKKRTTSLNVGQKAKIPKEAQEMMDLMAGGYTRKAKSKLEGVIARLDENYQSNASLAPQVHQILEANDYHGEETVGSVRERHEKFFTENKAGYMKAFGGKLLTRMQDMSGLQEQANLAHVMIDKVPLGTREPLLKERLRRSTATAYGSPGADMSLFAPVKEMFGGAMPKNSEKIADAYELAGDESFEKFSTSLGNIMGEKGGLNRKKITQVKELLASQPAGSEHVRLATKISAGENPMNLPASVVAVANAGKAIEARSPGIFKENGGVTQIDPKTLEALNKAYKEQGDAQKHLTKVMGDGTSTAKERAKAELEVSKTNAAYREVSAGVLKKGAQERLDTIHQEVKNSGGLATYEQQKEMNSAIKEVDSLGDQQVKARADSQEILSQEKAGPWGNAARKMLGGFGLMYAKSIYSMATEGLGYGYDERVKYDQTSAGAAYNSVGGASSPLNQQLMLNTNKALYGANNDPRLAGQALMAKLPGARDALGAGLAGISTWGYTQFAAKELNAPGLSSAAPYIGMIAATSSLFANANSKAQDPASLAYRTTTGRGGPTDYLALAEMAGGTILNKATGGSLFSGSPKNLTKYFANKKFQVSFQKQFEDGATTDQLLNGDIAPGWVGPSSAEADKNIGKAERFGALQNEVANLYQNYSTESQSLATSFLARSGMSAKDDRLKNVITDYELGGGQAEKSAMAALQGLGYNNSQMYSKGNGQEFDRLSSLQLNLANSQTEEEKAVYAQGTQALGQLRGASHIEGVGANSKSNVTDEKINKLVEGLGLLVGKGGMEIFTAQQNASDSARRAGMNYTAPKIEDFLVSDGEDERGRDKWKAKQFTAAEVTQGVIMGNALETAGNNRIQVAQNFANNAMRLGNTQLADKGSEFLNDAPDGQQWKREKLLNGDAQTMAMVALGGVNLSTAPALTNIQGKQIDASMLANTDISNEGRITGLQWGRTGLQRGSISAEQMGKNFFGSMNNIGTQAAIGGSTLRNAITLADGTVVDKVAGTMGVQNEQNIREDAYQTQMLGFQGEAQARDYAFTMASWKIQDKQRALGHRQQLSGFAFQEEGMQMQQQNIDMQNKNFWQNAGLQQQQTTMQRGFQREDWAVDDKTRAMQWGWKTEDFQEQQRFMTGRDRRLAERGMERDTTMHGVQEDKVTRDKARQQELWNLEDTRFDLQKSQHTEGIAMQEKQLDMQHRQFDENKKFYFEGKKLEDEMIKLQRAHWLEEHNASKVQLGLTQAHQKAMMDLKQTSDQLGMAAELNNGLLGTLVEDSLMKFQDFIIGLAETLQSLGLLDMDASGLGQSGSSDDPSPWVTGGGLQEQQQYASESDDVVVYAAETGNTGTNKGVVHAQAGGGESYLSSMSNVIKTGEAGWEYIINGQTIPHDKSVELERQGIMAGGSVNHAMDAMSSLAPQTFSPSSSSPAIQPQRQPTTIVVNIGNTELKRFVVDSLGNEF